MPTFVAESALPTSWGAFLLQVPLVDWFNDSVLTALGEMSIPSNWRTDDSNVLKTALAFANEMNARYKLLAFNPFPVGMIMPFGGEVAPAGYLMCDGSSYLASDYPELFAQIGYYYGGSDDNFNVPNLYNRVVVGSGDNFNIGDVGGSAEVTLDVASMPSHSHTDIGHSHGIGATTTTLAFEPGEVPVLTPVPLVPAFTGSAQANLTNTGGDGSHNNMQPFLATIYVIYAGRENA